MKYLMQLIFFVGIISETIIAMKPFSINDISMNSIKTNVSNDSECSCFSHNISRDNEHFCSDDFIKWNPNVFSYKISDSEDGKKNDYSYRVNNEFSNIERNWWEEMDPFFHVINNDCSISIPVSIVSFSKDVHTTPDMVGLLLTFNSKLIKQLSPYLIKNDKLDKSLVTYFFMQNNASKCAMLIKYDDFINDYKDNIYCYNLISEISEQIHHGALIKFVNKVKANSSKEHNGNMMINEFLDWLSLQIDNDEIKRILHKAKSTTFKQTISKLVPNIIEKDVKILQTFSDVGCCLIL